MEVFDHFPPALTVAILATPAKATVVMVVFFVTVEAIARDRFVFDDPILFVVRTKFHNGLSDRLVAFGALYIFVFVFKWKFAVFIVIKLHRAPARFIVASGAFRTQLTPVKVFMARHTVFRRQIRKDKLMPGDGLFRVERLTILSVTFGALQFFVTAF